MPSRAANTIHVAKMVNAFISLGHELKLVYPNIKKGKEFTKLSIAEFYNVIEFSSTSVPWFKFPGYKYLSSFFIGLWLLFQKKDLIYSRNFYYALFASALGNKNIILELHKPAITSKGFLRGYIENFYNSDKLQAIVVISQALRNRFLLDGFSSEKIIVAHDGCDEINGVLKRDLGFGFHVGYIGHLYEGKGMEIIQQLAYCIKDDVHFHIVGGTKEDISFWEGKIISDNITFHGFVPSKDVYGFISAMDICLLPNQLKVKDSSGSSDIGDFTSPLKMFDYMALGKAIIASDLAVLREVLDENNSILCDPSNIDLWVEAIEKLKMNRELRESLGSKAKEDFLTNFTWKKRAQYIIEQIENIRSND
jgi:glycosyltransferase involved in cell wall biosynthesis